MILKMKLKNSIKGFTLIELMVSTTIFTIVMVMGLGSLVSTSNAAKSANKLRIAVDNINFAMESMTRDLRMGTNYYCLSSGDTINYSDTTLTKNCNSSQVGKKIAFIPQTKPPEILKRYAYQLYNNKLQKCTKANSCIDIVSDKVEISYLRFYVSGAELSDNQQPSVRIAIKGVVTVGGMGTPFSIQTMVSQRSVEK